MKTDRFPDLPAILAKLPEAKRAELGWRKLPDGFWYNNITGSLVYDDPEDPCPPVDHYAVLAVVLVELLEHALHIEVCNTGGYSVSEKQSGKLVDTRWSYGGSIFSAAAAAYMEVCNADH